MATRRSGTGPLFGALLLWSCCAAALAGEVAGERIYREGRLPDGQPVRATVQSDIPLEGARAACVNCHQRSGLGSSEGGKRVLPVAAPLLFQPRAPWRAGERGGPRHGPDSRPAYDADTLRQAIRAGIDPSGRVLDPLMPRYAVDDDALEALLAYLRTLSAEPAPGVSERTIRFATVVTAGVDPRRRKAMLEVMETFVRDRGAATRLEGERARRAPWTEAWEYGAYRQWVLDVWELDGPAPSWDEQLDRYYRERPVFALLSGLGGDWQPVHDFCERRRLPCLLPNTDLPVTGAAGDYTIYFSAGLTLEARAVARHLAGQGSGPVVQVYRRGEAGEVAAQALAGTGVAVRDRLLAPGERPDRAFWQALSGAPLVVWLGHADLGELPADPTSEGGSCRLYLSASLAGQPAPVLPAGAWPGVCLAYPYALPGQSGQRVRAWLRARRIEPLDERIQANTLFALTLAGDALMHARGHFYRDYFIERVEHGMDNALPVHVYPSLSLGTGQRYAAKACAIARLAGADGELALVSSWAVP